MKRTFRIQLLAVLLVTSSVFAADKLDVCGCQPRDEKPTDYRFAEKHIPLPDMKTC
jgi:hypothetical protein